MQDAVLGIPIPSREPAFISALVVHVGTALLCVGMGIGAMLSRKGRGRHTTVGLIYFWGLGIVAATMTVMATMRWSEDRHLFLLGVASLASACVGRLAIAWRWTGWVRTHIAGMGLSYMFLLIAFYVDNGPNLPLWRAMPRMIYWLLPTVVGLPLIVRAMLRHPLVRR